jgi:hypothetical protein
VQGTFHFLSFFRLFLPKLLTPNKSVSIVIEIYISL